MLQINSINQSNNNEINQLSQSKIYLKNKYYNFHYIISLKFLLQQTTIQYFLFIKTKLNKNTKQMKIVCQHIASNCNPMPSTFSFLSNDTIAYCYKNQIGLYSLIDSCVYRNIHFSKQVNPNRANCIKTYEKNQKYYLFVGYDSGDLVIYGSTNKQEWQVQQNLKQANSILGVELEQDYLLSINNDALVTIYHIENHQNRLKLVKIEEIQFPLNKTIQTVALKIIKNQLVIFLGGVDQKIHCYSKNVQNVQEQINYHFSLVGHQNSITKLTVLEQKDHFLLASSSKDGYIRIWKITENQAEIKFHKNVKTLLESYKVFLDSVLISHQCSVTSLHWANFNRKRQLLSSSLDCTICVWSQSQEDGSWSVESRMGQFLGNKNAYFDITSNKNGTNLAALNYIGSILVWNYQKDTQKFILRQSTNGHYNEVKDIDWNYSGDFLVSVSKDQTTRIMAQNSQTKKYHQISRAQIHGYDINTVCLLKTKDQTFDILACGADEKVVRIFEPPACFANYFNSFTNKNFHLFFNTPEQQKKYLLSKNSQDTPLLYETYTEGGAQVLGLMTKVQRVQRQKVVDYFDEEQEQELMIEEEKVDSKDIKKTDFNKPPHDDYLVKHTLWPEMNKLYAHPHQIQYLCRSPDSKQLASCCRGLNKEASSMIIWNTENWKIHKILTHHSYTVYKMQFSKNKQYFASVSKDRKLAVFTSFDNSYDLLYSYEAHSRAITSLSISSNQQYIVTGSRDKTIKLHSINDKKVISTYQFKLVVTAVAFCNQIQGKQNIVAVGLINGDVYLLKFTEDDFVFNIVGEIPTKYAHTEKINAIRWNGNKLATCSDDHSVAIFRLEGL